MNKYLIKVAEATAKKQPEQERSLLGSALFAGAGLGTIANQYSRGNLTGRETLYHGSSKPRIDQIKREGVQPNRGGGVTRVVSEQLESRNKPYAFAAKDRFSAATYAAQQEAIEAGKVKDLVGLMASKQDFAKNALPKVFNDKGTIAKINLPTHLPEYRGRANPEIRHAFRGINQNIFDFNKPQSKKIAYMSLQNAVHTNKGAIPAEYIKGSTSYKPNSMSEIAGYVRNNPKRFLKGLGLASGVGGGLLAASAYAANPGMFKTKEDK